MRIRVRTADCGDRIPRGQDMIVEAIGNDGTAHPISGVTKIAVEVSARGEPVKITLSLLHADIDVVGETP